MLAAIAVLAAHSSPNAQQTLNIGLYANEPKLFRDDDGEPAGFWPELVAAVAEELSIEPRFIDCNLSQCLDMLEAGELDIMSDVAFSEERDRRFLFGSHTVLYSWSEILVPRGSTITNINDLDGRTIAVVDGSIAYDELRSMVATGTIGATILPVREASDGPPMVERGEVDAVVLNRLYASRVAESSTLIKLNRPFVLTQLLFAYPPGTPSELIEAVDQAVYRQQSERGSAYIQAKRRWIDGESYAIPDWLLPVLIALAAISATAGFSTMLMRRTVQRRTAALREVVGRLEEELVARKRAEAAAAALQKAEALGRLVGGIAHDFNNHLAVILGNLERLRQRVTDHEALEELRDALAAAERGSKLTRQLLASGRRAALQPRTIDMNRVVADMHGLLRRTLPAMIALETRLTPDLRPIEVDLAQLESALLNLVINARDAMPKGGNITIGTESI
ncbi:MAG: transporter substrate-binding domain-containing protein, partial [Pseudomonadota bacterium]